MDTMINKGAENMQQDTPKYRSTLVDLIQLRYTDYDAFMDRLFEALTGEFKDAINDVAPKESKLQAINSMIDYFSDKEEYEKCAQLHRIVVQLESEPCV